MANPFSGMSGNVPNLPGPLGNVQQIMQAYSQFKANFQGDPHQKIQELLQSGRINQQMLDQAQQMAGQFKQFLK